MEVGESVYTVKEAYFYLSESYDEEVVWTKDVWNQLISLRLAALVWRLFDNLNRRGVRLN